MLSFSFFVGLVDTAVNCVGSHVPGCTKASLAKEEVSSRARAHLKRPRVVFSPFNRNPTRNELSRRRRRVPPTLLNGATSRSRTTSTKSSFRTAAASCSTFHSSSSNCLFLVSIYLSRSLSLPRSLSVYPRRQQFNTRARHGTLHAKVAADARAPILTTTMSTLL